MLPLTERLRHDPEALANVVDRVEELVLASVRDKMTVNWRPALRALGFAAYEVEQ